MSDADQADELARRLLLLRALAARVAEATEATKAELAPLISVGTLLRPQLADGQPAGSVSYTTGRSTAQIYSEPLFTAWVRQHHPGEINLEPVVDPDFRAQCLVMSEKAGVPASPFGETSVGGIRTSKGEPVLSARPDKKRAEQLWQEIRESTLLGELGEGKTND